MDVMGGVNEADLVYEGANIYLRRFTSGYIIILMGILAPVAMVRLSCNLLCLLLKKGCSKGWIHALSQDKIVQQRLKFQDRLNN